MPARREKDTLGTISIDGSCLYGAQTQRAVENFPISNLKADPAFIRATGLVKLSVCEANLKLSLIDQRRARAIIRAATEVADNRLDQHFVVDAYQAGAGTSHNMNANEVIANRANELLGKRRGAYEIVHPNDHVNMSQSTNDVFPTAMRVACLEVSSGLVSNIKALEVALKSKSREFKGVIKSGRTHFQDAVPVTLGQEFGAYAESIKKARGRIKGSLNKLTQVPLGATAVGTGMNTDPRYRRLAIKELSKLTGQRLRQSDNPFEALSSMGDFTALASALKGLALELIKISNDLRLLSSGPRTGLSEIRLKAVQPGSSIMPGKVNPVMAEMLLMVCYQVIGAEETISLAAQSGSLELNVMGPVINHNALFSIKILSNAIKAFIERCVAGIEADKEQCKKYFEDSIGLSTVLNPYIGYAKAAEVAKEAISSGKTIRELILEKGLLSEKELDNLLDKKNVTKPGRMKKRC